MASNYRLNLPILLAKPGAWRPTCVQKRLTASEELANLLFWFLILVGFDIQIINWQGGILTSNRYETHSWQSSLERLSPLVVFRSQ